jgi:predicted TIM-barrel fold metal-dependent hydrolase
MPTDEDPERAAMIAVRVFDRLPGLQVIIGHMGEMLPFMLDRADEWLTPAARQDGLVKGVARRPGRPP